MVTGKNEWLMFVVNIIGNSTIDPMGLCEVSPFFDSFN